MMTTLMQTINDFPTYEMVSSQSKHEKLAYSYYMEKNKSFMLTNDDKKKSFFTTFSCFWQQIAST